MFALSTYPLHLAFQWWDKRFGPHYEPLETERDTQGGSSDVDTSEVPTSFLASSSGRRARSEVEQPELATVPPKVVSETSQVDGRQLSNSARLHNSGPPTPNALHDRNPQASLSTDPRKETRRQRTLPPSQKNSTVLTANNSSAVNSANMEPTSSQGHRRAGREASSRHQIWHPPRSSYIDDGEDQVDLTLRPSNPSVPSKDFQTSQEAIIAHEQQQLDEWRQYPPFPSAYPPTPLVVTSRLAAASIVGSSTIYPPIEEERSQQDFRRSLLPPREPLNPSLAGDLSDQSFTFGISPYHPTHQATTTDEADDSMSTDDYEDEDEFNMTLRTPLQPLGSLRSHPLPRRLVPLGSGSSAVSTPNRLSALTTIDDGSSLRTRTSSESLSASISIPVSVIGKKRSYPRTKTINIKNRVRQIEDKGPDEITNPDPPVVVPSGSGRRLNAIENPDTSDTADDAESSLKSSIDKLDKEQIPPEEKRRKVTRSSSRALTASRPNIKRHPPLPPSIRKGKGPEVPVATKRASLRMKSGLRTYLVEGTDESLNGSSSASTSDPPPPVPPKLNTRLTRRR